jgi:hypothetical protein
MLEAAANIEILVVLQDATGSISAQKVSTLPVQNLEGGESYPFLVAFQDVLSADEVVVEMIDYQMSGHNEVKLEVTLNEFSRSVDGRSIILGWLSNPQDSDVHIHNFILRTSGKQELPPALIIPELFISSLVSSEITPFLAVLDDDPNTLTITPYIDAVESPALGNVPFSFSQETQLNIDSQGNHLLQGMIKNNDSLPHWVSCLVSFQYQDRLISLSSLHSPIPLAPGEARAFSLTEFPGWQDQFSNSTLEFDHLEIEFFCDPLESSEFEGQIFNLTSEVTGFETTGSTLFIRGSISNLTSQTLPSSVVQADLRSIDGYVEASNWLLIEETLEPGDSVDFILPVRLPAGTSIPDLEIDVRAIAVLEESDLPI